jgi:hypothetical protein
LVEYVSVTLNGYGLDSHFELGYNDNFFYGFPALYELKPLDSVLINIRYISKYDTNGTVSDSIIAQSECFTTNIATINSTPSMPKIKANDAVIHTKGNKLAYGEFDVSNIGSGALNIVKISGPSTEAFDFKYYQNLNPTDLNPIIISSAPNNINTYSLVFRPSIPGVYKDSIIFYSNFNDYGYLQNVDSICYLTGISEVVAGADENSADNYFNFRISGTCLFVSWSFQTNLNNSIELYSIEGILLNSFVNNYSDSGSKTAMIDIKDFSSGLYFLILRSGTEVFIRKVNICH